MPACIHSDKRGGFCTMFLRLRDSDCSWTSVSDAPGQCEHYNGIICTTIKLAIKSRKPDLARRERASPDALHSTRSLLRTATNAAPHERLFHFTRRSTLGESIPTWLRNLRSSEDVTPLLMRRSLCMRHPAALKCDSRLAESRQCLCEILHPWKSLNLVHLSRTSKRGSGKRRSSNGT